MKINKRLNSMFLFLAAGMLAATGFTSQAASLQMESPEVADAAYYIGVTETETWTSEACEKLAVALMDTADINRQNAEEEARRREQEAKEKAEREAQEAKEKAEREAAALEQQKLLASIIFCEAGNQPYEGQVAVGAVVMNRVKSGSYPNTIEEVIYQPGQFGPVSTGWLNSVRKSGSYTQTSMQAAADVMAGANPVKGCLYFDKGGCGIKIGAHYFH